MPRSHSPRRERDYDRREERDAGGRSSHRERSRSPRRHRDDKQRSSGDKDRDYDRHRSSRHERERKSYDSLEEEERARKKKEKRSREHDESKAARKAAKRAHKDEEEASAQRAAAAEALMYSADANPFNDADLGSQFKWGKKEEKEKKQGMSRTEAEARDRERRREAAEEIARLNQKRAEREKEQSEREEEEARMARLTESAAMSEWVAREDEFHLEQSRKRAEIRVRENRAKPIDLLAINLKWADPKVLEDKELGEEDDDDEAGLEIDLEEPYLIFENLTLEETEELHRDIQMYLTLETIEKHLEFWRSMIVVCDDKLDELRGNDREAGVRARIDPAVKSEMDAILEPKSYAELVVMQDQVHHKLNRDEMIDVEYWEGLLRSIIVWRAKAKLRDMHEVVLANRIAYLRKRQGKERAAAPQKQKGKAAQRQASQESMRSEEGPSDVPLDASAGAEAEAGPSRRITDEERAELAAARARAEEAARAKREAAIARGEEEAEVAMWKEEAKKGMEEDEEAFEQAEELVGNSYQWEDKYRPRKPRYFNRVHTGYEWSRYNQTHYDSVENPPPKVIQGYKFNIFYPDLIDKTKTPSYKIRKDPDDPDTCLIVFSAGPPYEDIGFRIVNKPWNQSHRRGFRASFDRGVLQVYFNFERQFYRK